MLFTRLNIVMKKNIKHGFNKYPKSFWENLNTQFKSKTEIAKHLNVGMWSVSYWMNYHQIDKDGRRVAHNKLPIPPKEELENLYQKMSLLDISKHYGNVSNVTIKKWLKHHNIPQRKHSHNQRKISVPKSKKTCMDRYGKEFILPPIQSKAEIEIRDWLNNDLGLNFQSNRSILSNNRELDGYDPQQSVAFEYCGLWWHCEKNQPDKKYHWKKYIECQQKGIKLFTIYENEWRERKPQIQNFLKGALGKSSIRIYARECWVDVHTTRNPDIKKFLNDYHIQGAPINYQIAISLSHKNEIVGVMTLGKHHRQNGGECLVLSRLCWRDNYCVIGGTKRLLSYAPKDKPIVSWSDNRWSPQGGVYQRMGFDLVTDYPPGYDYTNNQGKFKRKQSMKKSNIAARPNQTEKERCEELGWYRIWDCGKRKWVLNPKI